MKRYTILFLLGTLSGIQIPYSEGVAGSSHLSDMSLITASWKTEILKSTMLLCFIALLPETPTIARYLQRVPVSLHYSQTSKRTSICPLQLTDLSLSYTASCRH